MFYFEELSAGDIFSLGSYQINKFEMIEFALKYDPQPFHFDELSARESIYGDIIASGWQTNAIYMKLFVLAGIVHGMGSPGIEELKWRKPVFANDVLIGKFTILEKRPFRGNLGLVIGKNELTNQKNEIVLSFTGKMLILKKAAQ
ncbi:MAG: MaoC/PaaZ C-terminal domain-containing protein [Leptospira sp.]|nr:MaoC/PaaZ C-terminal domain-containing protein [Leptospira sp.]